MGPAIDVLDIGTDPRMSVREIILRFGDATPPASPAEVRAALADLHEPGHVYSCGLDADVSSGSYGRTPRVMRPDSEVRLTCRGLVAARELAPGIGRPVQLVTFVTRMGKPMLNARFDTGNPERDASLNASAIAFAVTLVVAVVQPTEQKPLFAGDCVPYVERLRVNGLRQVSGPTKDGEVSEEAVSKALQKVGPLLGLKRQHLPEDKRRECYFLTGPLPEFRISAGDRAHCGDWESYRRFCWLIINDQSLGTYPDAERILFPAGREKLKRRRRRRRSSSEREDSPAEELPARESGDVLEELAAREADADSEE